MLWRPRRSRSSPPLPDCGGHTHAQAAAACVADVCRVHALVVLQGAHCRDAPRPVVPRRVLRLHDLACAHSAVEAFRCAAACHADCQCAHAHSSCSCTAGRCYWGVLHQPGEREHRKKGTQARDLTNFLPAVVHHAPKLGRSLMSPDTASLLAG